MKKLSLLLLAIVLLSGCSDSDRFDGLIVVDGDGRELILKHNVGDTYFVDVIAEEAVSTDAKAKNNDINQKLKQTNKGETE